MILLLLLSVLFSSPAAACGGGWVFDLDAPLVPTERHLDDWLAGWDGYEVTPPPFTRFLYAVHGEDPGMYAALEQSLYQAPLADAPAVAPIKLDAFHAALRGGDRAAAHSAAAAVVEAVLDLPTALADSAAALLPTPVEYLELEPHLAKVPTAAVAAYFLEGKPTGPVLAQAAGVRGLAPSAAAQMLAANPRHPRAASLRWLALRAAMQRDIPDGWSRDEIAAALPPAVADQLVRDADRWLADYPGHPLADYVRMARLRVQYLRGDTTGVWKNLLDLHTRHPARALGEMRFVLLQGLTPPALDLLAMPPALASALLPYTTLTGDVWAKLWRSAEASPGAPWSLPLRERLLWQAAVGNPTELPDAFPSRAEAPSMAWGRLRLHALLGAGRFDEAWAQTEVLGDDAAYAAPIRAQLRLRRQDWVGALREPGLTPEGRAYLLRVLAPDDALRALVDDAELGGQARLELGLRARAAGDWRNASALVAPAFPDRARLFAQAQKLERKGQTLPLARFYRAQAGKIFLDNTYDDIVWYRSLPVSGPDRPPERASGLPFDATSEWSATSAWLQRSFATYAAFAAYARWLDTLDVERLDGAKLAEARAVLDEADRAYNLLLNYGSWDGYAWGQLLPASPEAATVRRVGKALRERAP